MIIILKRYSFVLHFVTIALCSYLLAQSISTLISSKLESISPLADVKALPTKGQEEIKEEEKGAEEYVVIAERNIFNSVASAVDAKLSEEDLNAQLLEGGPAVKTSLDIKVLGTLVVGGGEDRRSSVTVSGGGAKTTDVYFVGDKKSFGENIRLTKVMKDRIEFFNRSRLEYAELEEIGSKNSIFRPPSEVHGEKGLASSSETEEAPAGQQVQSEGEKIVVDQSTIDDAMANLDRFYTEVRIVPYFKAGKVAGMKVLSVKPGSIVGQLGIRRGDILEKINGQELDVQRGLALFNELKNQKNFTIDIQRGGKSQSLEYEIR